ncbi:MAG: hypothetical protein PHW02_06420 [bacterium]|nr:hypothetical protein [bacterium]
MKKRIALFVVVITAFSLNARPNALKKPVFNVSFEPYFFYQPVEESFTLYANLIPVSLELALSDNNGIQLTPLAGLKFYQWGARFGLLGAELSFPVYYTPRTGSKPYGGYYTSGVISGGYNVSESYVALTAANETGVCFTLFNLSMGVAFQAGGTYFLFSEPTLNKNTIQMGFLARVGFWL